jgi:diguanylate cyclase (GGDEF)-like protein
VQQLNERLGHQAGDAALQAVARALSVTFHRNDVLARVGGTQFLALTLEVQQSERAAVTGRIRGHLSAPATRDIVGAPIEVCCGWTTRQSGERSSLEDLIARSDWAMLESREGRLATFGPGSGSASGRPAATYSTRNALPPRSRRRP